MFHGKDEGERERESARQRKGGWLEEGRGSIQRERDRQADRDGDTERDRERERVGGSVVG